MKSMMPTLSAVGGVGNRPWNPLSGLDLLQRSTDACKMRAANPLTRDSTLPKKNSWNPISVSGANASLDLVFPVESCTLSSEKLF